MEKIDLNEIDKEKKDYRKCEENMLKEETSMETSTQKREKKAREK